jgi:hypothetical protein
MKQGQLLKKEDGDWLAVYTTTGRRALVNLSNLFSGEIDEIGLVKNEGKYWLRSGTENLALDQINPGEEVKKTLYEWAAEENAQSYQPLRESY